MLHQRGDGNCDVETKPTVIFLNEDPDKEISSPLGSFLKSA